MAAGSIPSIPQSAAMERARPAASSRMAFVAGFFFSFRSAMVLIAVFLLGMEPSTGTAINIALNLLLLLAVCFHSLTLRRHAWSVSLRQPPLCWALAYLAFALLSLAWSETVSRGASFAYGCALTADVAIAMVLLRDEPIEPKAHAVMKGFIAGACLLAVVAWLIPAQKDLRLGDPDFLNTNQIANLCAFAIFFCQYLARRGDGRSHIATILLSLTLLRSLSKTTIAAFVAAQIFVLLWDRSMPRRAKIGLMIAAVITVIFFWGLIEAYSEVYRNEGNQSETLSGRTGIWAVVAAASIEKPWLGHGMDAMWKVIPPFGPDRFEARHAENELLQQFYAYGVAGLALLAGVYGSLIAAIRRMNPGGPQIVLGSILVFVLVRGLAEAEPFDLLLPLWTTVLISVLAARSIRQNVIRL